MTGSLAKETMYSGELGSELLAHSRLAVQRGQVIGILDEFSRHLLHGENMIDEAGADRAAQNRVIFRGFECLCHGHAAIFLDCPQTARAVGARAREHDADGGFAAIFGERAEEAVDRGAVAARFGGCHKMQHAFRDRHRGIGRNDIDPAGRGLHILLDLLDTHRGVFRQQLGQRAFMIGRQMLHYDKSHGNVCRQLAEELFERFQAARRCAYRNDQELVCVVLRHLFSG